MTVAPTAGRPTRYSSGEDAIILATTNTSAEETNRQLREAGFGERSPNALKVRRHYLQHRVIRNAPDDEDDALTRALLRRRHLTAELTRAELGAERIKAELAQLNATIHELLERLKEELGED